MLPVRVWRKVLGLGTSTAVERVDYDEVTGSVVAHVRPGRSVRRRCGRCGTKAPLYDRGKGRRQWRCMDHGLSRAFLEADSPRVNCPQHGPTVAQVPWARHDAGHTRVFDDTVAWLATRTSKTTVTALMGVAWRTVGAIVTRVNADISATVDRLEGLARIGIDEISYKKNHLYLTVVCDHDTGRLVWAAPGRSRAVLEGFFAELGEARCALITHVSCDGGEWIHQAVRARCPQAVLCLDPFHVVKWATRALDLVRRRAWNQARGGPSRSGDGMKRLDWPRRSHPLRAMRWALWKNPENLTDPQRHQLDWLADNHPDVFEAYRLKEGLRYAFAVTGQEGIEALQCWIDWAHNSGLGPFIALAERIQRFQPMIEATLTHRLSNSLVESTNAKIRLLHRQAFGYHHPHALIALAMLAFGGHQPPLPGRSPPTH